MKVRVEAHFPGGGDVACLVSPMDLHDEPWETRLLPLAELVFAAHPDAVWTAVPIPEAMTEKEALTGHAR